MNDAETVTIILSLPPPVLSPNRQHGSKRGRILKANAARKHRKEAKQAVEKEGIETGAWEYATMQAVFYHKQKRRRDGANHNNMLKAAQDGVVDAGLLVDDDADHCDMLPPRFAIDQKHPRVELTITRVK